MDLFSANWRHWSSSWLLWLASSTTLEVKSAVSVIKKLSCKSEDTSSSILYYNSNQSHEKQTRNSMRQIISCVSQRPIYFSNCICHGTCTRDWNRTWWKAFVGPSDQLGRLVSQCLTQLASLCTPF